MGFELYLRLGLGHMHIGHVLIRERVLYAAGQLRGAALDWWESHRIQDREAFTWIQFRERFRSHNVPAGVMKTKKKEFLALKQVNSDIIL